MTDVASTTVPFDKVPGDEDGAHSSSGYVIGFVGALLLTLASFWAAETDLIWGPGVPVLISVLAIAQMGVHLAFFLHISSAPDHTNTILALAFGLLIVALVIIGSLWIMGNLDENMVPMTEPMAMQH